ncbi:MAG: hypothetical protein M3Y56_14805 [Armatimonadota bacterium]|nr:hypothetical protein [Armatimonadota bacterium]
MVIAVSAANSPAAAQPSPTVRQAIDAAYSRLEVSMGPHGSATQLLVVLKDILAPGALRVQMLRNTEWTIKNGGDHDEKLVIAHSLRMNSLTVTGRRAVAVVVQRGDVVRTDSAGSYGARGKDHRLSGTMLYRDTWIKTPAGWRLTATEGITSTMMVDGKPWNPPAAMTIHNPQP